MPRQKKNDTELKVLPSQMISVDLLEYDTKNTNKQSRSVFKALVENIRLEGFDEPLVVIPHPQMAGRYLIIAGNHRCKAAKTLGYTELPCIVREDWNEATAYLQAVRRNTSRGALDKAAFTVLVDELQSTSEMSMSDIQEGMGITDVDVFADMYVAEQAIAEQHQVHEERVTNNNAKKVKLIEDLEMVLTHIFEEYGNTVPSSFIVFPSGGRKHLFVQANNSLKNVLTKVAAKTHEKGMDLNTVLSGLITIGLYNSDFLGNTNKVEGAAAENVTAPEDTDFDAVE